MDNVEFSATHSDGTKVGLTISSPPLGLSEVCQAFRSFLIAAGFDYVDYSRLADTYADFKINPCGGGMTLQEAIKSGKDFKRRHWEMYLSSGGTHLTLGKIDLLADDWEIEEKKVEITRPQLERAIRLANIMHVDHFWVDVICKELGL